MSKPNTIKIDDIEYVRIDQLPGVPKPEGDYVIVRCRNAGVHAGYLKSRDSEILELENSRRLWRWWSKFSLSGLATCGVLESKKAEVRFACVLPKLQIPLIDIGEIIFCTKQARESIESIPEHIND